MSVSLDTWVTLGDAVIGREIEGETVIVHFDRAEYFGLNHTGSRVWQLLQDPAEVRGIAATVAEEFAIARDRAEADVVELVQGLIDHGLAKVVPAPSR
jgi:hypothetical protein